MSKHTALLHNVQSNTNITSNICDHTLDHQTVNENGKDINTTKDKKNLVRTSWPNGFTC